MHSIDGDAGEFTISEFTRRDLVDFFVLEEIEWAGRLQEPDFLALMFDVHNMPSTDSRPQYATAYRDIWQHRVNNYDWERDWVFTDSRFNLLHCDDEILLRFLCETIHPAVRPDQTDVEQLRQKYNALLVADGYEIVERARVSGRPIFAARQIKLRSHAHVETLKQHFDAADYVATQITRMEAAIYEDPGLAIGTAKELLETICRTILEERNVDVRRSSDLPQLVKQTAKELQLTPDEISEQAKAVDTIRRLLSNLAAITSGVAELRNKYGTGHGKHAEYTGLRPRHAKLAVGAASTLAVFLLETHLERTRE